MLDISDTMAQRSQAIIDEKKAALEKGDEEVVQRVGEGKDIMSVLCECMSTFSFGRPDPTLSMMSEGQHVCFGHGEAVQRGTCCSDVVRTFSSPVHTPQLIDVYQGRSSLPAWIPHPMHCRVSYTFWRNIPPLKRSFVQKYEKLVAALVRMTCQWGQTSPMTTWSSCRTSTRFVVRLCDCIPRCQCYSVGEFMSDMTQFE